MSTPQSNYAGIWLYPGQGRGEQFTHDEPGYDHPHAEGTTPMRHVVVEQEGEQVGLWVPATWSDDQAREALQTDW